MTGSTQGISSPGPTTEEPPPPGGPDAADARSAGLLFLALVITGASSLLVIRPLIFDSGDPAATTSALIEMELVARAGIALELATATTQALCALWFFRVFRTVDSFLAGAIAAFGMVNAVAILASAAMLATALDLALAGPGLGAVPAASQTMYLISENLWMAGNVFFGLWLIPMGLASLRSGWTPRILPVLLIVGGALYTANAFVPALAPALPDAAGVALTVPATIAEFWMVGWLLWRGVRRMRGEPRPRRRPSHVQETLRPWPRTLHRGP